MEVALLICLVARVGKGEEEEESPIPNSKAIGNGGIRLGGSSLWRERAYSLWNAISSNPAEEEGEPSRLLSNGGGGGGEFAPADHYIANHPSRRRRRNLPLGPEDIFRFSSSSSSDAPAVKKQCPFAYQRSPQPPKFVLTAGGKREEEDGRRTASL